MSGCVPPGTLGEANACRHLRQPMLNRLSLRGRLRHLTFPSPSCSRCLVLAKAIEREKKHEPGRSDAFQKLSHVCRAKRLPAGNSSRPETRPSGLDNNGPLKEVAAACTQGKRAQHGKPLGVAGDGQPDAREGQAGRPGAAERPVAPSKPGNAGGGKGP